MPRHTVQCVNSQFALRLIDLFHFGLFIFGPLDVLVKKVVEFRIVFSLLLADKVLSVFFVSFELARHGIDGASGISTGIVEVVFGNVVVGRIGQVCSIFKDCSVKVAKLMVKSWSCMF
jgi:hypothetical protein